MVTPQPINPPRTRTRVAVNIWCRHDASLLTAALVGVRPETVLRWYFHLATAASKHLAAGRWRTGSDDEPAALAGPTSLAALAFLAGHLAMDEMPSLAKAESIQRKAGFAGLDRHVSRVCLRLIHRDS
jgi:hypothetical protein